MTVFTLIRAQGVTSVGKQKKQGSKQKAKAERRDSKDAQRAIARAEKRLASALRGVEDARAELTRRETQLASLLRKYGRSPDDPAPTANGAAARLASAAPLSATPAVSEMLGSTQDPTHARAGEGSNPRASGADTGEHE